MEENHSSSKIILDCLLFTAIAVLLLFCGSYLPGIGTLVTLLWAFPVMMVTVKDGIPSGTAVAVVVAVLCIVTQGFWAGLTTVLTISGLGLFYGIALRQRRSAGKTLLLGVIAAGLLTFGLLAVGGMIGTVDIANAIDSFDAEMRQTMETYAASGLLDNVTEQGMSVQAYVSEVVAIMKQVLPGIVIVSAMLTAGINYLVGASLVALRNPGIRRLPPFRLWHLPWWIMWGIVVGLLVFMIGNFTDQAILDTIAKNIFFCYCPVFLLAGISLFRFFMVKWHMSTGLQVLLWVIAVLFLSFSGIFLLLFGAMDTVLDYRTALEKKKKNNEGGHEK